MKRLFNFWKRPPKKFEVFVTYYGGLQDSHTTAMVKTIIKANQLGLEGRKVLSVEERSLSYSSDPWLAGLWLTGEQP